MCEGDKVVQVVAGGGVEAARTGDQPQLRPGGGGIDLVGREGRLGVIGQLVDDEADGRAVGAADEDLRPGLEVPQPVEDGWPVRGVDVAGDDGRLAGVTRSGAVAEPARPRVVGGHLQGAVVVQPEVGEACAFEDRANGQN